MTTDKLLHIYLSDHRAGAHAGRELAKRCLSNNEGSVLGDWLARDLLPAIENDRRELESVMDAVGAPKMPWKQAAAWAVEKVGRLKLNGQVRGYSPLSRLLELEGLALGVEGKLSLWRSLQSLSDARLRGHDFDELIASAGGQRAALEERRVTAAKEAFGNAG
jgi:hypothetical protein